ncbi:MAG: glycosyltransferase family 2 protein [Rickettsiales bacterium]
MQTPVISYVVTVYNKEPYIGYTARSLMEQEGNIPSEYIFVDDVSTDRSVEVLEEIAKGRDDITIIRNTENAGPSVRLNQGAQSAKGKYLQFIDSDDILAANASRIMMGLLEKHDADVIYGRWKKTGIKSASLIGERIDENAPYISSNNPMDFIFEQRILRMTQMVARDTFMASGGCDEKVFIQDETIALRLARVAKKFILLDAPVVLVPDVEGELSRNISQLNHDRFFAIHNMITDFPDLMETYRKRFYARCISAVWKQVRHDRGMPGALMSKAFMQYTFSKIFSPAVDFIRLQAMSDYFKNLKGVRRIG